MQQATPVFRERDALTAPDGLVMKPTNGKTRIVTKQKSAGTK